MLIVDPNSILQKHRRFLKGLEEVKNKEREEKEMEHATNEEKKKAFKENAAK